MEGRGRIIEKVGEERRRHQTGMVRRGLEESRRLEKRERIEESIEREERREDRRRGERRGLEERSAM